MLSIPSCYSQKEVTVQVTVKLNLLLVVRIRNAMTSKGLITRLVSQVGFFFAYLSI